MGHIPGNTLLFKLCEILMYSAQRLVSLFYVLIYLLVYILSLI